MAGLITRTPSVFAYRSAQEGNRLRALLEAVDPELRWAENCGRLTDSQVDIGESGYIIMLERSLTGGALMAEAGWLKTSITNNALSVATSVCASRWGVHRDDVWVMSLAELEQLLGVGCDEAYDCTAVSCADIFALTC